MYEGEGVCEWVSGVGKWEGRGGGEGVWRGRE